MVITSLIRNQVVRFGHVGSNPTTSSIAIIFSSAPAVAGGAFISNIKKHIGGKFKLYFIDLNINYFGKVLTLNLHYDIIKI